MGNREGGHVGYMARASDELYRARFRLAPNMIPKERVQNRAKGRETEERVRNRETRGGGGGGGARERDKGPDY